MKYYYKIYGLILESDYEFHQFVSIEKDSAISPDIKITYGGILSKILDHVAQKHYMGYGEHDVWFNNQVGTFWIHDRCEINFVENEHCSIDDAALFLPGLCLSILLWYRGDIMLHGACLYYNDKTIVISGNSGAGKSTLTTELIKHGAKLLADDVTCIRQENDIFLSHPAFPFQKLCADQIDKNGLDKNSLRQIEYDLNKYEVGREDVFCSEMRKVDVFYRVEIQDVGNLVMEEVVGGEKLKTVVNSIFIKWIFNEMFKLTPKDFLRCTGFANQIQMYKIVRPRGLDTLKNIVDYINETLKGDL
ncbi:hypothetical protein QYZ88_003455 [Lachnospiraceae bacterium C1.1]|nr:hypothetical protein [Lachnospiraceae bacterium C1.1]